jgi:putative membrane protein
MSLQFLIAYIHILIFGIGFYAIWTRANALKKLKDNSGLPEVFKADNFWGLAALLWIITGLWRAFGGLEKGSNYYLHSTAFLIKMALFALVFVLELKPMITLIQWRIKLKKGQAIDFSKARSFAFISHLELGLITLIVLFAVAMSRGIWY